MALAGKGLFAVEPNPPVGCVLEREGRVVGEGWHLAFGGPHAEVVALQEAGDEARGATAYISLEPCSRVLKTGACTAALAEAGVARVVFASADPNMPAEGLEQLRSAGIQVEGPSLEEEGSALLHRFRRAQALRRPWVALKWAMSLDGRIAPARGRGGRISGTRSQAHAHDLRGHADAVAVGVETVLVDDPRLTCRLEGGVPHGRAQPLRVVFDSSLRTPPTSVLLDDAPHVPVLVICVAADAVRREGLEACGAEVAEVPAADGGVDLTAALALLHERGVRRLLVEGGARVHGALIQARLADQVHAYVAPIVLGGGDAPFAVSGTRIRAVSEALRLEDVQWRRLDDDLLLQGYLPGRS
jgi:diaminohydroxyphosphoribosylaminopyrimidine deaminase/5-amino-6-(5-phosphoribosylamino)uracil reductase